MIEPVEPAPAVPKTGNKSILITHYVAILDSCGYCQFCADGSVSTAQITETYVWNQDHRGTLKANKGHWTIAEELEEGMFELCRNNGAFKTWKGDTHMGWSVCPQNDNLIVIGTGVNNEGKYIDVKVAKFVEGNKGMWHGYPIDYRMTREDTICDNALECWVHMGFIDKSEIQDIKLKEDSSLVCE